MKDSVSPYQPRQYVGDILKGQLISVVGGILAGIFLASRLDDLKLLPGFFILFPGFLELQGDINTTLAARIGSLLHTKGIESIDELRDPQAKSNLLAAFLLSAVASLSLGVLSFLLTALFLRQIIFELVFISFLAGLLVSSLLIPLTLITSAWLYKKGYDPDNVMGPILTSLTDIMSVIVLILLIGVLTS